MILLLGCSASAQPAEGPQPRAAAGGVQDPPRAQAAVVPRARRSAAREGHSLEQAHARRGSQVQRRVRVSLLGHVPKRLVQAFHKTLPGPRRVVSIARDAPTWREAAGWAWWAASRWSTGQQDWGGLCSQARWQLRPNFPTSILRDAQLRDRRAACGPPVVSGLPRPHQWVCTQVLGQSSGCCPPCPASPGACLGVPTGSSGPLPLYLGCRASLGPGKTQTFQMFPGASFLGTVHSHSETQGRSLPWGGSCSPCLEWPPGTRQRGLTARVCRS